MLTEMVPGSNCDVDEAFDEDDDDDDDDCVDGETQLRQDDNNLLVEGQSLCPSTDLIIVMENHGKHIYTLQYSIDYIAYTRVDF